MVKRINIQRPRRNRKNSFLRNLLRETKLCTHDLVMPLFVIEGKGKKTAVKSMPGIYRYSVDLLVKECVELKQLGVQAVALFPVVPVSSKNKLASLSCDDAGCLQQAIRAVKSRVPDLIVFSDVAMDPYSSDGHDGLVGKSGEILNDETLPILARMAVSQARAGSDFVSPSDMMDGRVGYIRTALDDAGFHKTGILAYSAKYASAFYGPFRDALGSKPKKGNKKTYQMDPANVREALREVFLDIEEGADMVMVKPGLPYLDVIRAVSDMSTVPVFAYNVSGEYAMIKAAATNGLLDYRAAVMESLAALKRAGSRAIFTYHAKEAALWLGRS